MLKKPNSCLLKKICKKMLWPVLISQLSIWKPCSFSSCHRRTCKIRFLSHTYSQPEILRSGCVLLGFFSIQSSIAQNLGNLVLSCFYQTFLNSFQYQNAVTKILAKFNIYDCTLIALLPYIIAVNAILKVWNRWHYC